MDSTTLLYDMQHQHQVVGALSFNYGSKHNERELLMAEYHCTQLGIHHQIIPLDFIAQHFSSNLLKTGGDIPEGHYEDANMVKTVVPFRNAIMLSIASGYAESIEADAVAIAAHSGDHMVYPDCRDEFMNAFASSMELGTYAKIKLLRPYVGIRKEDIATIGHKLNVDFSKTYSCYNGGQLHCGKCGTCVERKEAFALAQLNDPTNYSV